MRSERGYAGYRLMAGMGLVAVAVWLVPTVLMRADTPDGPGTTGAPAPAIGSTGAVPDVPGATGATGSAGLPSGPIGMSEDLVAQALLNDAIRVAQVYYAENGSFEGFGPDVAKTYDPNIAFTAGGPGLSLVSMRGLSPTTVVLVMLVDGGGYLCAAASGDVVTTGRAAAQTPLECQGGWE